MGTPNSPFSICLICSDEYGALLKQVQNYDSESILVVYLGKNATDCENYFKEIWKTNPNISLSTFDEPPSFYHCELAKNIIVSTKIEESIKSQLMQHSFKYQTM